jgi:hypothetical protein
LVIGAPSTTIRRSRSSDSATRPARRRSSTACSGAGQRQLAERGQVDFFAKFGERQSEAARQANAQYLVGLGHLGHGRASDARAAFERAIELDVNHLGAATELAALK